MVLKIHNFLSKQSSRQQSEQNKKRKKDNDPLEHQHRGKKESTILRPLLNDEETPTQMSSSKLCKRLLLTSI